MTRTPLDHELPVADAIVAALAEGGVRYVLGMPGGLTGSLWRALHEHPTIRAIQVREESIGSTHGRGLWADDRGNRPSSWGKGNGSSATPARDTWRRCSGSSPLVILTEMSDGASLSHHAPYQSGTGDYGTWDARPPWPG